MDIAKKPRNVISFCSGYAGIEQGLSLAGLKLRTLAYVEIEAFAIANLVAKMESGKLDAAPVWSNLKTFPAQLFRDRVDILTAGYPCQPFSTAGKRAGKDDPRHLWPYIREHVQAIKPVRCFFENVEGHISLGLREVIEDLESLGYKTAWGIFSASEVGAPHQRKRVYIMADTDDSGNRTSKCRDMSEDGTQVHEGQDRDAQSGPSRCGEELADSDNAGQQPSDGAIRQSEVGDNTRRCGQELADAGSTRLQRFWAECGLPKSGRKEQVGRGGDDQSTRLPSPTEWEPEPGMGRVVDGCADRVDRLRLLGNAVVPQTAARAWEILSEELTK